MADVNHDTKLIALGNDGTDGLVYYESADGVMTAVTSGSLTACAERTTAVIAAFQKVYFASISTANVGVFKYLDNLDGVPTWTAWTAASGTMPTTANIGCLYRARIVLAGCLLSPHQWYMCRQGDPTDWLYAANDAQSAVSGGDSVAAESGDVITCLAPFQDDYLVIGGAHSVDLMRGDPCAGGSLDKILESDGVFGPTSYCFDGEGNLYFMGMQGLYLMERGGGIPKNISIDRLPEMMQNIDRENYRISMAYDKKRHGVIIAATKLTSYLSGLPAGEDKGYHYAWWYDTKTNGFFPESYDQDQAPYSLLFYASDNFNYAGMLVGGMDGYIRVFDDDSKSDQDASGSSLAISSHAVIGPMDFSIEGLRGKLNRIDLTMGNAADAVSYELHAADSAEQVLDAITGGTAAMHSGTTAGSGRQKSIRAKARGAGLAIKLYNSTVDSSWQMEKLSAQVNPAGRLK